MNFTIDKTIRKLFYYWGIFAFQYRYLLVTLSILLTILLSIGFKYLKLQTTIDPQYVFSPINAPWRFERDVLREHWPLNEEMFWPGKSYDYHGYVDIIAAGKMDPSHGRPNILREEYLDELNRINQFIIYNLTVPLQHDGNEYQVGFLDLCMTFNWKCFLNDHITMLMPRHRWQTFDRRFAEFTNDIINSEVKVTYPIGWRGTEPIYFGALVGSPHLTDEMGHFNYARAIRMTYNVRDGKVSNVSMQWRKKLANFLTNSTQTVSDLLEFGLYHNESLPEGLQEVADELTPKFAFTCVILFTVCFINSIVLLRYDDYMTIDWARSKPIVTVAGLLCPLLSILSGFGLLLWMGCLYNAIVNVSPFIVFCIGVDDMFIMNAAWHRTNPLMTAKMRLSEALADAAVSISITSITDMLSFGIGCFTTLPSVQMFCLYTFMGIFFTYLYQITFYTSVMAIAGEWEMNGLHSMLLKPVMKWEDADSFYEKLLLVGSSPSHVADVKQKAKPIEAPNQSLSEDSNCFRLKLYRIYRSAIFASDKEGVSGNETLISALFRDFYGPFLLADFTKRVIVLIYIIYVGLSILGCSMVVEGLNPKFLVKESFYLNKFYVLMDETFWKEGLQMQVVINSPPDFFNKTQRKSFETMMSEFENTYYTMAHNATMFWLDAYNAELERQNFELKLPLPSTKNFRSNEWYERCGEWLIAAGGRRLWEQDMVWNKNISDPQERKHLRAFRFQLGLRNYRTPTDHMRSAQFMRRIAAKYPQFNVTTFHEYYPFADQYIELKPALIRNCILALFSMLIVSFLMIPNFKAAFVIVGAILSIDIGLIGFMTFWNVRLESVSMITVIMSIGFAVDLSAHIGYAYVTADGCTNEKAIEALQHIGWPIFLGAFSTMAGILILSTVDAYIVQIFFKTVFLVVTFSLMHGVIFLPVFLTIVLPGSNDNNNLNKREINQKRSTDKRYSKNEKQEVNSGTQYQVEIISETGKEVKYQTKQPVPDVSTIDKTSFKKIEISEKE